MNAGQLFGAMGFIVGMGIAVLTGTVGLGIFLLRSNPSLKLYSTALWSALLGLASLSVIGFSCGWEGALFLGLPSLAVGAALAANSALGKRQFRDIPAGFEAEERRAAVDRLGRRIWFPLMAVVGIVGGLLAWGGLSLVF